MARPGVYKGEVRKARAALIAQGKHPSVDSIRAALGHTGSKSTLHRLLKEIEQEASIESPPGISAELLALVRRLTERLNAEADERVLTALEPLQTQLREQAQALVHSRDEAQQLREQLERTEQAHSATQRGRAEDQQQLAATRLALEQWQERAAGFERQLTERDAYLKSTEAKYTHAQQALTHFREAAKTQREEELRRHEHERQTLQVELRRAQESLAAKIQDLLQLNRDNERLTARVGQLETAGREAQVEAREQREHLSQLREVERQHRGLTAEHSTLLREQEALRQQLSEHQVRLSTESQRRAETELLLARALARLEAMEHAIERLRSPASVQSAETEAHRS